MFSGSWKESNQSLISLDIPDLNITKEGAVSYSLIHIFEYLVVAVDVDVVVAVAL